MSILLLRTPPMVYISIRANSHDPSRPSQFGIGEPRLIRDITTEVFNSSTSLGGRNRIAFVHNHFTGGEIGELIQSLSERLQAAGADVQVVSTDDDLLSVCRSSIAGYSQCYAAASFHSSPTQGPGGVWSYTARVDFGLGMRIYVDSGNLNLALHSKP